MASDIVHTLPEYPGRGLSDSYDEKVSEKGSSEKIPVDIADIGDVYEDVRAIDLGADCKERPIGTFRSTLTIAAPESTKLAETAADWSLRLISLEVCNGPTVSNPVADYIESRTIQLSQFGHSDFGSSLSASPVSVQYLVKYSCAWFLLVQ